MSLTRKNRDLMGANYAYFKNYPIFEIEFYPKIKEQNKGFSEF